MAKLEVGGKVIGADEYQMLAQSTVTIFEILEKSWASLDCSLIDMKIEFGVRPDTGEFGVCPDTGEFGVCPDTGEWVFVLTLVSLVFVLPQVSLVFILTQVSLVSVLTQVNGCLS